MPVLQWSLKFFQVGLAHWDSVVPEIQGCELVLLQEHLGIVMKWVKPRLALYKAPADVGYLLLTLIGTSSLKACCPWHWGRVICPELQMVEQPICPQKSQPGARIPPTVRAAVSHSPVPTCTCFRRWLPDWEMPLEIHLTFAKWWINKVKSMKRIMLLFMLNADGSTFLRPCVCATMMTGFIS